VPLSSRASSCMASGAPRGVSAGAPLVLVACGRCVEAHDGECSGAPLVLVAHGRCVEAHDGEGAREGRDLGAQLSQAWGARPAGDSSLRSAAQRGRGGKEVRARARARAPFPRPNARGLELRDLGSGPAASQAALCALARAAGALEEGCLRVGAPEWGCAASPPPRGSRLTTRAKSASARPRLVSAGMPMPMPEG